MQNDQDGFEEAAIGLEQRDAVRGISKLFGLHEREIAGRGAWLP
jgi:hypothetical protein